MSRKTITIYILTISLLVAIYGCQSSRHILKKPLRNQGSDYLITQLEMSELQFDTFKAKASVDYHDKKSTSFKIQLRIKKDSVIWASIIPAVGIEAIRVKLFQDSIFLINRLDKTYFKGDYSLINKFLDVDVDFNLIQAMITGSGFAAYHHDKCKSSIDSREYRLTTLDRSRQRQAFEMEEDMQKIIVKSSWILPEIFKLSRIKLKEVQNEARKIDIRFDDYEEFDGKLFPKYLYFDLSDKSRLQVDMKFLKVEFDEQDLEFPFKVSSKYEQIILR